MKTIGVVSASDCKGIFGEKMFSRLIYKGIIKYATRGASSKDAYIQSESLPQRFRQMVDQ